MCGARDLLSRSSDRRYSGGRDRDGRDGVVEFGRAEASGVWCLVLYSASEPCYHLPKQLVILSICVIGCVQIAHRIADDELSSSSIGRGMPTIERSRIYITKRSVSSLSRLYKRLSTRRNGCPGFEAETTTSLYCLNRLSLGGTSGVLNVN